MASLAEAGKIALGRVPGRPLSPLAQGHASSDAAGDTNEIWHDKTAITSVITVGGSAARAVTGGSTAAGLELGATPRRSKYVDMVMSPRQGGSPRSKSLARHAASGPAKLAPLGSKISSVDDSSTYLSSKATGDALSSRGSSPSDTIDGNPGSGPLTTPRKVSAPVAPLTGLLGGKSGLFPSAISAEMAALLGGGRDSPLRPLLPEPAILGPASLLQLPPHEVHSTPSTVGAPQPSTHSTPLGSRGPFDSPAKFTVRSAAAAAGTPSPARFSYPLDKSMVNDMRSPAASSRPGRSHAGVVSTGPRYSSMSLVSSASKQALRASLVDSSYLDTPVSSQGRGSGAPSAGSVVARQFVFSRASDGSVNPEEAEINTLLREVVSAEMLRSTKAGRSPNVRERARRTPRSNPTSPIHAGGSPGEVTMGCVVSETVAPLLPTPTAVPLPADDEQVSPERGSMLAQVKGYGMLPKGASGRRRRSTGRVELDSLSSVPRCDLFSGASEVEAAAPTPTLNAKVVLPALPALNAREPHPAPPPTSLLSTGRPAPAPALVSATACILSSAHASASSQLTHNSDSTPSLPAPRRASIGAVAPLPPSLLQQADPVSMPAPVTAAVATASPAPTHAPPTSGRKPRQRGATHRKLVLRTDLPVVPAPASSVGEEVQIDELLGDAASVIEGLLSNRSGSASVYSGAAESTRRYSAIVVQASPTPSTRVPSGNAALIATPIADCEPRPSFHNRPPSENDDARTDTRSRMSSYGSGSAGLEVEGRSGAAAPSPPQSSSGHSEQEGDSVHVTLVTTAKEVSDTLSYSADSGQQSEGHVVSPTARVPVTISSYPLAPSALSYISDLTHSGSQSERYLTDSVAVAGASARTLSTLSVTAATSVPTPVPLPPREVIEPCETLHNDDDVVSDVAAMPRLSSSILPAPAPPHATDVTPLQPVVSPVAYTGEPVEQHPPAAPTGAATAAHLTSPVRTVPLPSTQAVLPPPQLTVHSVSAVGIMHNPEEQAVNMDASVTNVIASSPINLLSSAPVPSNAVPAVAAIDDSLASLAPVVNTSEHNAAGDASAALFSAQISPIVASGDAVEVSSPVRNVPVARSLAEMHSQLARMAGDLGAAKEKLASLKRRSIAQGSYTGPAVAMVQAAEARITSAEATKQEVLQAANAARSTDAVTEDMIAGLMADFQSFSVHVSGVNGLVQEVTALFRQQSQQLQASITPVLVPTRPVEPSTSPTRPLPLHPSTSPTRAAQRLAVELANAFAQLTVARGNLDGIVSKAGHLTPADVPDCTKLQRIRDAVAHASKATAAAEALRSVYTPEDGPDVLARALLAANTAVAAVGEADAALTACVAAKKAANSSNSILTSPVCAPVPRQLSSRGSIGFGPASLHTPAPPPLLSVTTPSPIVAASSQAIASVGAGLSASSSTVSMQSGISCPGGKASSSCISTEGTSAPVSQRVTLADIAVAECANPLTCVVPRAPVPVPAVASTTVTPAHPALVSFMSDRRVKVMAPPQLSLSHATSTASLSAADSMASMSTLGSAAAFDCYSRDLASVMDHYGLVSSVLDGCTSALATIPALSQLMDSATRAVQVARAAVGGDASPSDPAVVGNLVDAASAAVASVAVVLQGSPAVIGDTFANVLHLCSEKRAREHEAIMAELRECAPMTPSTDGGASFTSPVILRNAQSWQFRSRRFRAAGDPTPPQHPGLRSQTSGRGVDCDDSSSVGGASCAASPMPRTPLVSETSPFRFQHNTAAAAAKLSLSSRHLNSVL